MRFSLSERQAKFAREVGSVVLGVLIALGLGAIATQVGWWIEVRQARHALDIELGELIGQGEERAKFMPCVERRLDEIAAIVASAEARRRLPPVGAIANPAWRTWPRGVWGSTIAAQTASQFDRDVLDNYSSAYQFAAVAEEYSQRELEIWTKLTALVGPGRDFDHAEAIALREAIAQARLANRMVGLVGIRMKQVVIAFELGYDRNTASEYSHRPVSELPICRPIGATPPASYGQAPLDGIMERAIANPITRDSIGAPPAPKR